MRMRLGSVLCVLFRALTLFGLVTGRTSKKPMPFTPQVLLWVTMDE